MIERVYELDQVKMINTAENIKCSVCRTYKPLIDYNIPQSRTNCKTCYETPTAQWESIKANAQALEEKMKPQQAFEARQKHIDEVGTPVEDLIKALQELPEGSKIVMDGADWFSPAIYAIHLPKKIEEGLYSIATDGQREDY